MTLRQVYLEPYRAAVEAGAATLMSSFNTINGVPASANPWTLTTILRGEWKFDGFVVSDWGSVAELLNHSIAANGATAALKALTAGVDMDMEGNLYSTHLVSLVRSGELKEAVVDEAVRRVLRVKFALGLFEHPYTDVTRRLYGDAGKARDYAEGCGADACTAEERCYAGHGPDAAAEEVDSHTGADWAAGG